MSNSPALWEHSNGYHLNADGKSIEYRHKEDDHVLAIVEAMVNEEEQSLQYYTAIFNTSSGKPWGLIEPHEIHHDKDSAQEYLYELMEKHS